MNCLWCKKEMMNLLNWRFIFSKKSVSDDIFCEKCQSLPTTLMSEKSCPGCFRPQTSCELCADCEKWIETVPRKFVKHRAMFAYDEFGKEFMKRFKYQGDVKLAEILVNPLKKALKSYQRDWLITIIPSSAQNLKCRGFNQLDCLLKTAGVEYTPLLAHQTHSLQQAKKSRQERLQTKQPFKLVDQVTDLKEKRILIIDDVYTTGRTILHAKNVLQVAKEIDSMTIFR